MWQKELIDYFYLVIGRSDGSEAICHVVDIERKGRRRKPSKLERICSRDDENRKSCLSRRDPVIRLGLGHVRSNLMTNLAIWLATKQKTWVLATK